MAGADAPTRLGRAAVLAYRLAAHDLAARGPTARGPTAGWPGVLDVGVQDTPPGATAALALRARTATAADPYADPGLALVHGVRGTMHLHRAVDLSLLAAALRPDDAADLLVATHGRFFLELAAAGLSVGAAFDAVAGAMARVMADRTERTKGQLSGAVTPLVPEPLAPWCGGCGARHVHDGLFRMASLAAGLRLRPTGDGSAGFLPPVEGRRPAGAGAAGDQDRDAARRELLRRFLRRCGPAGPDTAAAWLGLADPAARRWWALLAGELVDVEVDGRRRWVHAEDLPALVTPTPARGVRLLPPYDPILELADRALAVPDPARRRLVWRAAANPGVVLVDGDVVGLWRQRRARGRTTVTVTPFGAAVAERDLVAAAESLLPGAALSVDRG